MSTNGTKVLLVDCVDPHFAPSASETLRSKVGDNFTILTTQTAWNGGAAPLDFQDAQVIFIRATYNDLNSSALHANDGTKLQALVAAGALVVVFVGTCASFHIANLTGEKVTVTANNYHAASCVIWDHSSFDLLFATLGHRISVAHLLNPVWKDAQPQRILKSCADQLTGFIFGRGKGQIVFLPDFGQYDTDAIELVLTKILPSVAPHLLYDDSFKWLEDEVYLMPTLAQLRLSRAQERTEHEKRDQELERQYKEAWENLQKGWNELLSSSGDTLKLAVKRAFELFGYGAIDVDEFWKNQGQPERRKEEDLWLAEGCVPDPSKPGAFLVEVKSSGNGNAKESDYTQLIKYMNRRKAEFGNGALAGILAINHSYLLPAANRPAAFTGTIISDAERDNVRLVTTWELFRLVQKILARQIAAPEIRTRFSAPGALGTKIPT